MKNIIKNNVYGKFTAFYFALLTISMFVIILQTKDVVIIVLSVVLCIVGLSALVLCDSICHTKINSDKEKLIIGNLALIAASAVIIFIVIYSLNDIKF